MKHIFLTLIAIFIFIACSDDDSVSTENNLETHSLELVSSELASFTIELTDGENVLSSHSFQEIGGVNGDTLRLTVNQGHYFKFYANGLNPNLDYACRWKIRNESRNGVLIEDDSRICIGHQENIWISGIFNN